VQAKFDAILEAQGGAGPAMINNLSVSVSAAANISPSEGWSGSSRPSADCYIYCVEPRPEAVTFPWK
jgi:hypothetical protein